MYKQIKMQTLCCTLERTLWINYTLIFKNGYKSKSQSLPTNKRGLHRSVATRAVGITSAILELCLRQMQTWRAIQILYGYSFDPFCFLKYVNLSLKNKIKF